jgi:hypothetical protein
LCFCQGNYAIVGPGMTHWTAVGGSQVRAQNRTIAISNTPDFPQGFANATTASTMFVNGNTYVGAATGKLYNVASNAVMQLVGDTLPGDAAGTTATGGLVV